MDREHREHYGTIVKLNPKTVTIICEDEDSKWRVAYAYLFRVLDADSAGRRSIVLDASTVRPS